MGRVRAPLIASLDLYVDRFRGLLESVEMEVCYMNTREPIAVVNSAVAIVEALIALAVGLGAPWSKEIVGLLMAVVVAVGNLVKTLWARSQVTPLADPRDD